jgi:hypothetical protein
VLTGKYARPYSEYPQVTLGFTVIIKAAKNHLRPTIPAQMPAPLKQLIGTTRRTTLPRSWHSPTTRTRTPPHTTARARATAHEQRNVGIRSRRTGPTVRRC